MTMRLVLIVAAVFGLLQAAVYWSPARAQQTVSVKFGYFSGKTIQQGYPEAMAAEELRQSVEAQLRQVVVDLNQKLKQAGDEHRPKDEIEQMAKQFQTQI